jgi:hypothetical protein
LTRRQFLTTAGSTSAALWLGGSGSGAEVRLAEVSRLSTLIADRAAPAAGVRRLEEQGMEMVLV